MTDSPSPDSPSPVDRQVTAPGVWTLTLRSPPANALGPPILRGLQAEIDAALEAGDVHVMILASDLDRFFAAGADISHMSNIDAESFLAYGDEMRAVNDRLAGAPWLSIAAIDGLALGGGLELALACTMRIASPAAGLGVPEVKLGLIPGAGGTQRLAPLVGRGPAIDMVITGRRVPADEALSIGLVDRVADDPVAAARELAAELTSASLPAQLAGIRCVDASYHLDAEAGAQFEIDEEQALFEGGDAAEGLRAFVEKRPPRFGGRG